MTAVLAVETVVGAVLLVALALLAIAVRRRILQRGGGSMELSLRLRERSRGRGWVLGVGSFAGDELRWHRVFSLALRPRRTLSRRTLTYVGQRQPTGAEAYALLKGAVVLECLDDGTPVQLALEQRAVTGFLAWLEAQAPGTRRHL